MDVKVELTVLVKVADAVYVLVGVGATGSTCMASIIALSSTPVKVMLRTPSETTAVKDLS